MTDTTTPTPDKAAILAALAVLFTPDEVIELRAFPRGRKRTDAGYFDSAHWPDLAEHAAQLSNIGAAVYVTLNPVDAQLLGRYSNRIESFATATTTDKQIVRRRWLLVDLDPARPAQTSASDTQLEAARIKAQGIYKHLKGIGWAEPVVAKSGNGYHLLYAIDLPNDDDSTALLKGVLAALADIFDDTQIKVDRSVFNAARICKLYGTVANKGDNTESAPWRLSALVSTPARALVTVDQLRMVQPTAPATPQAQTRSTQQSTFNLEDFLARHGLDYSTDRHDGRERFKLKTCPFNPEHVNGEAAVFRDTTGKLGFHCMHDSCSGNTWQRLRDLLDGPRQQRAPRWDYDAIGAGAAGHSDAWVDPTPLPNALPPVQAFDADLLPEALRAWVMDIANRMQCPPDFSAAGAIAALSSLIGARAVVQPKERDDWQVVPNLWALIVGRPGVMKSPALGEVMKPLNRLEATARELFQELHASWEIDCKVSKIQDDANEKKAKGHIDKGNKSAARELLAPSEAPAEPVARSFVETNTTVEALGVTLQQNPWGLIVYRDEIYSFLTTLDREENQEARGFYLQGYDGNQGYKFKRIIRGETWLDRVCIAMLGGIQPGKIERYVRDAVAGGIGDDGLLQRFGLTVWPDIAAEFVNVDQWPDTPAKQAAWTVFERLAQLQPATDTDPVVWRFSADAQAIFNEWRIDFETEIRGDDLHPAMASHLAKYRKLIPALALVFALIDTPNTGGIIHEGELIRALAWGDYLRSHANRLYAAAVIPETTDAQNLLAKIRAGKLADSDGVIPDSFTPRQVALKHWAGLNTPDAVRKAADVLVEFDYLRSDTVKSGDAKGRGRPSDRYQIHTSLLKGVAV